MSEERETRTREELLAAITVGAGLLAQGFGVLGGALRRAAQAFEALAKVIENQILTDMEQDLDVMLEDDEQFPLETESDDLDDPEDYDPEDEDEPEMPFVPPYIEPGEPPVNP